MFNYIITYEARYQSITQCFCWTGSTPWVKPSICKDNVASCQILLISNTSEMIQSIFIIWSDSIWIEAIIRISLIIKSLRIKHIFDSIHNHWHSLISACKNIPSTHIFIAGIIFINLVALSFSIWIIILSGFSNSREQISIIWFWSDWINRNTWAICWPSCQIL